MKLLRRAAEAADEERQPEHQQQVADDAAGDRGLDQLDVALAQRDDRDDQLGGVAEGRVEEAAAAPGRSGARAARCRGRSGPASGISETAAVMKTHGDPGDASGEHPGDRRRDEQQVEPVGGERAARARRHQSPNFSTSSSSAPGSRSKNASRLRSSERRSWGIVPSKVWSVRPAVEPSASFSVRFLDALERAFRDEPDAVDERVASHG